MIHSNINKFNISDSAIERKGIIRILRTMSDKGSAIVADEMEFALEYGGVVCHRVKEVR